MLDRRLFYISKRAPIALRVSELKLEPLPFHFRPRKAKLALSWPGWWLTRRLEPVGQYPMEAVPRKACGPKSSPKSAKLQGQSHFSSKSLGTTQTFIICPGSFLQFESSDVSDSFTDASPAVQGACYTGASPAWMNRVTNVQNAERLQL